MKDGAKRGSGPEVVTLRRLRGDSQRHYYRNSGTATPFRSGVSSPPRRPSFFLPKGGAVSDISGTRRRRTWGKRFPDGCQCGAHLEEPTPARRPRSPEGPRKATTNACVLPVAVLRLLLPSDGKQVFLTRLLRRRRLYDPDSTHTATTQTYPKKEQPTEATHSSLKSASTYSGPASNLLVITRNKAPALSHLSTQTLARQRSNSSNNDSRGLARLHVN